MENSKLNAANDFFDQLCKLSKDCDYTGNITTMSYSHYLKIYSVYFCGLLNTIKGEKHILMKGDEDFIKKAIINSHQVFLSQLHRVVEKTVVDFLKEKKYVEVGVDKYKDLLKEAKRLPDDEKKEIVLEFLEQHNLKIPSPFERLLYKAMDELRLPKAEKATWGNFFKGITVLRNKASHGEGGLSRSDMEKLEKAGFSSVINYDVKNIRTTYTLLVAIAVSIKQFTLLFD